MHTSKNRLKGPKIQRGTTSKVSYILFNTLPSLTLLNKSGLVRAKAINFNSKTLNKCFSNYCQVRTRPVVFWKVTFTCIILKRCRLFKANNNHNGCVNICKDFNRTQWNLLVSRYSKMFNQIAQIITSWFIYAKLDFKLTLFSSNKLDGNGCNCKKLWKASLNRSKMKPIFVENQDCSFLFVLKN